MDKLFTAAAARRLALAGALAGLLLAGAELALRATSLGPPLWHRPDPLLGWTLRPYAGSHGGGRWGQINAFGQRDDPREPDKRPGVYRIAVLGDERSEALGVRLGDAWWRQLAPALDRCGFAAGRRVEVLNFGVAAYSTAQEAIVLETAVMRYRPDLVLLQFSSGKDVRENSRSLATRLDRPFYRLDEHGTLRFDGSFGARRDFNARSQFRYELARELSDHSRLLRLLGGIDWVGAAYARASGAPAGHEAPGDARWEEAWRITAALLVRMRDFSERNGARFAVAGAPHAAPASRVASAVDQRLAAFGASHGIPYISLAPAMARDAPQLYAADGQWTVAGHRAAAQGVAAGLCHTASAAPARRRAL